MSKAIKDIETKLSLSPSDEAICARLREIAREKEKLEAVESELKETLLKLSDGQYFGKTFKLTVYAGSRESFSLTDAEKEQIRKFGRAKVTEFRAIRVS